MTLVTWRGVIGHNIPTQGVKSTSNPMFIVFWMIFVQKRRLSFFSHWLILIMERSQIWPDLRSLISKFWDIHFIDTVTCSNRWKFQGNRSVGVAWTNIQTFYEVRSLDVTWWPDLAWPGSEIFTTCAEQMYDKVCQKRRRCAQPFFLTIWKKRRGVLNNSPAGRRLNRMIDPNYRPKRPNLQIVCQFSSVIWSWWPGRRELIFLDLFIPSKLIKIF